MNEKPLISIVTPTFNSMKHIEEAYHSLLSQTLDNWEWLITDDCSTDSTYEYLLDLSKHDTRVKPEKLSKNSGAAVARNYSLDRVSGQYIAFLDSDDIWEREKLRMQVIYMEQNNINFSFTMYKCQDENGVLNGKIIDSSHSQSSFSYQDMLKKKATLGCSTVMLRSCLIDQHRMPLIRTGQDYAFWLMLLKENDAFLLKECLTRYRVTPGSLSRNKFKKARRQWQIYRHYEKINVFRAFYFFCHYGFHAIFRK